MFTLTVAVALGVTDVNVTVPPPEQVGRWVAPTGQDVSLQDSVMVPKYPFEELIVIEEVADDPGATETGVADKEKAGLGSVYVALVTTLLAYPLAIAMACTVVVDEIVMGAL